MPSSRERRVARAQRARTSLDAEWMVRLAQELSETHERSSSALLVSVTTVDDPDSAEGRDALVTTSELPAHDPVLGLFGRIAAADAIAVGMVGAARARSMDDDEVLGQGVFVHLVGRDGTSVTVVPSCEHGPARTLGPVAAPQVGRVPDACRRMLGLPSAPPPADFIDRLVDEWLELVLSRTLQDPTLSWADIGRLCTAWIAASPAAPKALRRPTTPAQTAELLVASGRRLSWRRYYAAAVRAAARWEAEEEELAERYDEEDLEDLDVGPDPITLGFDAWTLLWMDEGMYARLQMGEGLPRRLALDTLQQLLAPAVFDQVEATISLTGTPDRVL